MNALDGSTRALARDIPRLSRIALLAIVLVAAGCKDEKKDTAAAPSGNAAATAPAVTQASWAPDALEELLAPIALYPDALLGQILAASVNAPVLFTMSNLVIAGLSIASVLWALRPKPAAAPAPVAPAAS